MERDWGQFSFDHSHCEDQTGQKYPLTITPHRPPPRALARGKVRLSLSARRELRVVQTCRMFSLRGNWCTAGWRMRVRLSTLDPLSHSSSTEPTWAWVSFAPEGKWGGCLLLRLNPLGVASMVHNSDFPDWIEKGPDAEYI
jgi:hypothetical protein